MQKQAGCIVNKKGKGAYNVKGTNVPDEVFLRYDMALFSNQATLTYNGNTTNSNIVYGEILDALSVEKTAVEDS